MNEYAQHLNEIKAIAGLTDPESLARKEELLKWIEEHSESEEAQQQLDNFLDSELGKQKAEIAALRMQIEDSYEILPVAYIAKNYFGKTRQWLYQRLNGTPVRGHVYTLNQEQKQTFNMAVQDIARQIGSLRLA